MLRGNLSQNWITLLPKICEDYNNTPLKKLGWLKPNDISSIFDSAKVRKARLEHNINNYTEPTYKEQIQNQNDYEKNVSNLKENDYVYLDFKEDIFSKSFDVQVIFFHNSNRKFTK